MINQFFLAVFGVTAIFLSQSKDFQLRKWAAVIGLAGQPFWFYAAWEAEQWGIFVLCFFYTGAWMTGVYNYWLEPKLKLTSGVSK